MAIFDGNITEELLQKIFPEYQKKELDKIVKAGLIFFTANAVNVKHILFLDYLKKLDFIGNAYLQEIAQKILFEINNISFNEDTKMIVRIKAYNILNDNWHVATLGYEFSTKLYQKGQYYLSYQYILMAYNALPESDYDIIKVFLKVKILGNLIQTCFYLKEKCYVGLDIYINELESLINLYNYDFIEIEEYYIVKPQIYMVLSRYVHTIGDFEKELEYIT